MSGQGWGDAAPAVKEAIRRLLSAATVRALGAADRHWHTDLYAAQQLSRRIAKRTASGGERPRVVLAGLLFGTLRFSRTVTLKLDGPQGRVPFAVPDYAAFRILAQMFYDGDYDVDLERPPSTVVDLGGHVGISCLFFRRKWPSARIVTLEPSPTLFPLLCRNVRGLGVEARHAALADRPGHVEFIPGRRSWGGWTQPAGENGSVPAVTLDSLLEEPVDLLKLDVEGAELTAIPAATRLRNARVIVGEIHAPIGDSQARAVIEALERSGFDVRCRDVTHYTLFKAIRSAAD